MKNHVQTVCLVSALMLTLTTSVQAALVSASYSGTIDTVVTNTATDTYGLGLGSISNGTTFTFDITFDDSSANASYVDTSRSYEADYEFQGSPYAANLTIGSHATSSQHSAVTMVNDTTIPPAAIPQFWLDQGLPSTLSSPADGVWLGGYSNDFTYGGASGENGLIYSIDFIDLGGTAITGTSLPSTALLTGNYDLVVFQLQQWTNGSQVYQAYGVLANNLSTVPVPAAVWLFGSGLLGLAAVGKRKKQHS